MTGGVYLGGYLNSPPVRTIAVPAGTTTPTAFPLDSVRVPGSLTGQALRLEVHSRVTAGTGTLNVVIRRAYGRGF